MSLRCLHSSPWGTGLQSRFSPSNQDRQSACIQPDCPRVESRDHLTWLDNAINSLFTDAIALLSIAPGLWEGGHYIILSRFLWPSMHQPWKKSGRSDKTTVSHLQYDHPCPKLQGAVLSFRVFHSSILVVPVFHHRDQ